jgi:hypothetical protein
MFDGLHEYVDKLSKLTACLVTKSVRSSTSCKMCLEMDSRRHGVVVLEKVDQDIDYCCSVKTVVAKIKSKKINNWIKDRVFIEFIDYLSCTIESIDIPFSFP